MTSTNTSDTSSALLQRCFLYLAIFSLVILPLIPFYTQGQDGLALPINSLLLLPMTLAIIIVFIGSLRNTEWLLDISVQKLLIATAALTLLIIMLNPAQALNSSIVRMAFILLAVLLIQTLYWLNPDKQQLLNVIVIALFIQLIYGFIQYFILYSQENYSIRYNRPVGVFLQVNIMATAMATGLFLSYAMLLRGNLNKLKPLLFIYVFLCPLMLYLCSSRSAYLATVLGVILCFAYASKGILRQHKKFWFTFAAGIVLAILFANFFQTQLRSLEQLAVPGIRYDMYLHSLWMLAQKPLLGWGFGDYIPQFYYSNLERYHTGDISTLVSGFSVHPHNEFALWAIEGGIVGLAFICFVFFVVLRNLKQSTMQVANRRIPAGLLVLCPLFVHMMFEHPLYSSSFMLILLCLFYYVFTDSKTNTKQTTTATLTKTALTICAVASLPILLITFQSALASSEYINTGSDDARNRVISEFPSRHYIYQMDLLLDSYYAKQENDLAALADVNQRIRHKLNELPVKVLATEFKTNCEILTNCSQQDLLFIDKYFPLQN